MRVSPNGKKVSPGVKTAAGVVPHTQDNDWQPVRRSSGGNDLK